MQTSTPTFSKPRSAGTPEITMTRDLTKGQRRNVTPTKTLMPVERNSAQNQVFAEEDIHDHTHDDHHHFDQDHFHAHDDYHY